MMPQLKALCLIPVTVNSSARVTPTYNAPSGQLWLGLWLRFQFQAHTQATIGVQMCLGLLNIFT